MNNVPGIRRTHRPHAICQKMLPNRRLLLVVDFDRGESIVCGDKLLLRSSPKRLNAENAALA
jgi:hypothetical protein